MSALAGIVRFDGGPADVATVARMIDCVEHRGRDRRDVRAEGAVALAYRWQRTGPAQPVDEQPLFDRAGQTALVFDGRLDNRPELSHDLDLRDDQARAGRGDRHGRVPAVGARHASAAARRLRVRALGRARTLALSSRAIRAAIRSLSYAVVGQGVAFATEPRQLLRVSGVDSGPNLGFLGERLSGPGLASDRNDLPRHSPRAGRARGDRDVCDDRPAQSGPSLGHRPASRAAVCRRRAVRGALARSCTVRALTARLRGLDRVAVLLSGGLDSSSIVGMLSSRRTRASARGRPRLQPRASGIPGIRRGTGRRARGAALRLVPFVPIPFEGASLEHHLENARRLEDTIPGTLGHSDDTLAARMTNDGCPVVLTGIGGDEWFTGAYLHSADFFRAGRFAAGLRQLWADGHHPDAFHGVGVLARSCVWAMTPASVRGLVKRVLPRRDLVPAGFNRTYAAEVSLVERITPRPPDSQVSRRLPARRIYAAAMHPDGIYVGTRARARRACTGNELSAPLLDRRLAEFAMAIPEEQRWSGRTTKRVLRAAMAGILPDDVRMRRRKSDPGAVLFAEIRRMHDQGAFRRMELVEAGVLDGEAVEALYREWCGCSPAGRIAIKYSHTGCGRFLQASACGGRCSADVLVRYRGLRKGRVQWKQKRQEPASDDRRPARAPKKPYATPVVTEYGNVAKLTQGGNGSISDGAPFGSQRKSCL